LPCLFLFGMRFWVLRFPRRCSPPMLYIDTRALNLSVCVSYFFSFLKGLSSPLPDSGYLLTFSSKVLANRLGKKAQIPFSSFSSASAATGFLRPELLILSSGQDCASSPFFPSHAPFFFSSLPFRQSPPFLTVERETFLLWYAFVLNEHQLFAPSQSSRRLLVIFSPFFPQFSYFIFLPSFPFLIFILANTSALSRLSFLGQYTPFLINLADSLRPSADVPQDLLLPFVLLVFV